MTATHDATHDARHDARHDAAGAPTASPEDLRRDMLRIAMISPYSLTIPGGVQHQVLGLARELRRMGHEVRVLGPCDGPPPEPFVTSLGDSLPTAANGSVAPLAPDPSAALRTLRALNDEAFDILHLHEPMAPGPTAASLMLRLAPMVGTFHAAGDVSWYRRLRKGVTWLASHLDHRVAVSEEARELAHRYLGGDYEILFNGIDVDTYQRPGIERETLPTIFFCARHEPRKGLEVLLDAFALLSPQHRLWVASDGPNIGELKNKFRDDPRISWLGRITEPEKLDRLAACTVFCAPALHGESFGLVLLEAMAAGTPVVASDLAGYRTVVTDSVDGALVVPGDPAALASALRELTTDTVLAARYVAEGRRRAQHLSMHRLATRYVEIYRDVLAREEAREIIVTPNRLVGLFEERLLRRPRFARFQDALREKSEELRDKVAGAMRDKR